MVALAWATASATSLGSSLAATIGSDVCHSRSLGDQRNPAAFTMSLVSQLNGNLAMNLLPWCTTVIISLPFSSRLRSSAPAR